MLWLWILSLVSNVKIFFFPLRFLYLSLWLNQCEKKARVSNTSTPVVGNISFNAAWTALIYGPVHVHFDTVFNYIIICLMQCSKWTARRKEGLQVGLLSWYSGGLRLKIITCYCINSILIQSPKRPSLGGRGHLHLAFPNFYILGLAQDFGGRGYGVGCV